jgi:hypothetical protein
MISHIKKIHPKFSIIEETLKTTKKERALYVCYILGYRINHIDV